MISDLNQATRRIVETVAGYKSAESLIDELSLARRSLRLNPSDPLPVGVGYLCWQLEQPTAKPDVLLSAALDNHVQAIWLAFGNNIHDWIKFVRNYDAEHKRVRPTTIFVQVSSVEEALVASDQWKVDVLVAQGLSILFTAQGARFYFRCTPQVTSQADMDMAPPHPFSPWSPLSLPRCPKADHLFWQQGAWLPVVRSLLS